MSDLILPFRPFTLSEVQAISGVETKVLDYWLLRAVPPKMGDDRTTLGLDWMQTFGVFVGKKYLDEGAPEPRARSVVKMLGHIDHDVLVQEIEAGRTFPVPSEMLRDMDHERKAKIPRGAAVGMFVCAPPGRLGQALNLCALYVEFRDRLDRVVPNSRSLSE